VSLTTQQLDQYEREGIVFPVSVLSRAEADSYRSALELLTDNCGSGALKRLECLHLFFDWAHRLATQQTLLDAVEDILGDDILIDGTLVFHKPPRDSSYVSWHQDSVYSGWNKTPSTSAWIALTPSERRNGCMRAIPGSHKLGLMAHGNVSDELNLLDRGEQVEAVDESQAVDVVLQPGEISFHQSNLVHGSNPNTSTDARIGFIVRFVTSQIRDRDRPLLRVRGAGDCSHLKLAQPPGEVDHGAALRAWRTFSRL
jgi:ectoine hydroxylase-related dioxygenase (phytanoyl-CoA dioxygenase family)